MLVRIAIAAVDVDHLRLALAGLTAMNTALLAGGGFPLLYESGVVYRPEAPDEWATADIVLGRGYGDCEDLATWRAAELRAQGVNAVATVRAVGPRKWHAVVELPDGRVEDPSLRLGMRRYMRRRRSA